jgi:hypothetical protein
MLMDIKIDSRKWAVVTRKVQENTKKIFFDKGKSYITRLGKFGAFP